MHYLFFNGTISHKAVENVQGLSERYYAEGCREITLVLTSLGGDVAAGMGLYHYIRSMPYHFSVHASGICSSIAATILQAGVRRYAVENTHIALHQPTYREGPFAGQPSPNAALLSEPFMTRARWPSERTTEWFTAGEKTMSMLQAMSLNVVDEIRPVAVSTTDTWATINVPS